MADARPGTRKDALQRHRTGRTGRIPAPGCAADSCPPQPLTYSQASPGHPAPSLQRPSSRARHLQTRPSQTRPLQTRPLQTRPLQVSSSQTPTLQASPWQTPSLKAHHAQACRAAAGDSRAGDEPARDRRSVSSRTGTARAKPSLTKTARRPLLSPLGLALALMTLAAPALATPAAAETVLERVLARLGGARPLTGVFLNVAENSGAGGSTPRIDGSILLRVSNRIAAVDAAAPAITAATRLQIATGNLSTTTIGATNTGDVFTQFRLQAGFERAPADPGIDPDPDPDPGRASGSNGFADLGSGAVMTGLNTAIDQAATATARATRLRSGPLGVDPQAVMLLANAAANTGDITGSITIVLDGVDGAIAASDADLTIAATHGTLPDGIAGLLGRLDTTALGAINTGMIVSGVSERVGGVINAIAGSP